MNIHTLPSITTKKRRRLGQGHGSGRVKTSGRGTKGQNARSKRPLRFEGGALPLTKRLPFLRGKNRNKPHNKMYVVNVDALNTFPAKATVTIDTLAQHNLVKLDDAKQFGVKILGDGDLNVALTVQLPVSRGAKEKIEKAGGSVS